MRITENRLGELAGRGLSRGMSTLAKAAQQLETGLSVVKPSDDPTAWAAAQRSQSRATAADAHGQAIATTRDRLTEGEDALTSIGDSLSRARELATQLASGRLDETSRASGAAELRDLRSQILAELDKRASDGEALFSGGASNAFSAGGAYQGGSSTRALEVGEGYSITTGILGSDLASSLDTLTQLADAVEAGDSATVRGFLDPVIEAHERAVDSRSLIGEQIRTLDSAESTRLALADTLASQQQRLVGADPIEAASALARAQLTVESASQVASSISRTLRSSS